LKRCLSCNASYVSSIYNCPDCDFVPAVLDGFDSYAPDFAYSGDGYHFLDLASSEDDNFWFQFRNKLLLWAIESYCPNFESMLEIGCGTGFILSDIAKRFLDSTLCGSDMYIAGLGFAAARLPSTKFMQMDARNIPFENEFDVIGAFDVIEHIKEDEEVLTQICAALKPEGLMLLTVPQHEWLWTHVDEYSSHERRYTAADLHQKIEAGGFQVIKSTSFITILLPTMMISRFFQKRVSEKNFDAAAQVKISPWLNSLFSRILGAELALIKRGFNLPAGGSRLVIAKKV
jgi:SAM-dependent methyltransferase